MEEKKRLLVVSAHAADYVWRAGGTIAHYIQKGSPVRVIVLSLGVRGESNHLWKTPGVTPQETKVLGAGGLPPPGHPGAGKPPGGGAPPVPAGYPPKPRPV